MVWCFLGLNDGTFRFLQGSAYKLGISTGHVNTFCGCFLLTWFTTKNRTIAPIIECIEDSRDICFISRTASMLFPPAGRASRGGPPLTSR